MIRREKREVTRTRTVIVLNSRLYTFLMCVAGFIGIPIVIAGFIFTIPTYIEIIGYSLFVMGMLLSMFCEPERKTPRG